jgi:hypothetical protein
MSRVVDHKIETGADHLSVALGRAPRLVVSAQQNCPAAGVVARLVLALLVCAALLRAPLPMLHEHAEFLSDVALAQHLGQRHCGGAAAEGYHWHWTFPGDHDRDSQPQDGAPGGPPSEAAKLCVACQSSMSLQFGSQLRDPLAASSAARVWLAASPPICRTDQSERASSLLQPALRAAALLCVVRC